jgi:hypothetical protein
MQLNRSEKQKRPFRDVLYLVSHREVSKRCVKVPPPKDNFLIGNPAIAPPSEPDLPTLSRIVYNAEEGRRIVHDGDEELIQCTSRNQKKTIIPAQPITAE